MIKFLKKEDGLVTIEWVGIAAVMVLAAIAITGFIMTGADSTGTAINGTFEGVNGALADSPVPGTFGQGS